jgi:hypothetical protein
MKIKNYFVNNNNGQIIREDTARKWEMARLTRLVEIAEAGGSKVARDKARQAQRRRNRKYNADLARYEFIHSPNFDGSKP